MKQGLFEIVENKPLTDSVYKMVLRGDTTAITAPGQFVNILLDGLYLRRPISVCDVTGDFLTIVYKVVGKGTAKMAAMKEGTLDVLTGLGNGYDLSVSGENPVLLGGGVGVPPMYMLCRELIAQGKSVVASIDGNTVNIEHCDYSRLTIYLNDNMLNLDKKVTVRYKGKKIARKKLKRTIYNLYSTLNTRNDRSYAFPCILEIELD